MKEKKERTKQTKKTGGDVNAYFRKKYEITRISERGVNEIIIVLTDIWRREIKCDFP